MKNTILLFVTAILFSSCSQRIGDLTMASNRNIEFEKKHVELKRGVKGYSKKVRFLGIPFGYPNIEESIDDAIARQGTGEYLKNVTITVYYQWFLLFGKNCIRAEGDLMGYEGQVVNTKK